MSLAIITNGYYDVESLYQWDTNQVLEITGLKLAKIPEIHFHNASMDRAIVRASSMDDEGNITVNIPNSLLQRDLKINVYVCVYEDTTFKTVSKIEIPVKSRPRPTDYTIEDTDGEIYSFNALENELDNTIDGITGLVADTMKVVNQTLDDKSEYIDDRTKYIDDKIEYIDTKYDASNYNSEFFTWKPLPKEGDDPELVSYLTEASQYELLVFDKDGQNYHILPMVRFSIDTFGSPTMRFEENVRIKRYSNLTYFNILMVNVIIHGDIAHSLEIIDEQNTYDSTESTFGATGSLVRNPIYGDVYIRKVATKGGINYD